MAKWIDDLGDYLAKERPDKFRITKLRHWQFNTKEGWVTAPDHYIIGIILILAGALGWKESKGTLGKVVSATVAGIGTYLALDDIKDLYEDIKRFFETY